MVLIARAVYSDVAAALDTRDALYVSHFDENGARIAMRHDGAAWMQANHVTTPQRGRRP